MENDKIKAEGEVAIRKEVQDTMSVSLMKHEEESMHLSQKLALMKSQVMEYDRFIGMDRKYGSVRIQTLKNYPVTVSHPTSFILLFSSNSKRTKPKGRKTKTCSGF
jgi:hypothetical protein